MSNYNCIIVEDEPLAIEVIEDYVSQIPFLSLKAICTDAIQASEVIRNNKIDLIFLDIHLPKIKGFEFLKTLKNPPKVIITTAYHDYALSSYDYNVIDYLLKPIEFSRFLTAINKLSSNEYPEEVNGSNKSDREYLFLNVNKRKQKIFFDEILYIESQKEYININLNNKAITTKMAISEIESLLPNSSFLRIHRSFLIAKDKIDNYSQNDIEIAGKLLPIGRSYKELVIMNIG